jgi:hypothetical protein
MVAEDLLPQLKRIVTRLPPRRQTMIFTRTLIEPLAAFARTYLRDPIMVEVASSEATPVTAIEEPLGTEPLGGVEAAPVHTSRPNGASGVPGAKGRVASAMERRAPAPKAKADARPKPVGGAKKLAKTAKKAR